MLLLEGFSVTNAYSDVMVPKPTISIPDSNFEQALIDLGFDTNGLNGTITQEDADLIVSLTVGNADNNENLPNVSSKISDLTGIESFTNLKSLNCILNNITDLDLSNNTQLTVLNADKNNLESLNVANGNNSNFTLFKTEENPNLICIQVDNQKYSLDNWIFTDEQTGFSEDCSKDDAISNYYTTVPDEDFEKLLIYYKVDDVVDGKFITQNDLTTVVYNFVDMLSHSKTEMEVIKELAGDDKAYRSLTLSWFRNSPLFEIIQKAQQLGQKLIITTDHGTINCKHPTKIIGDKNISANLRYKTGKSLTYEEKDVYAVRNPKDIFLPTIAMNSSFVFAKEDLFFAYPNNFNHFVKYYKNTYQHGGISLEEVIIPCSVYSPK